MAMDFLSQGNTEAAQQLLSNAEELIASSENMKDKQKLKGITLNNLGCFYKRKG